jgi:hypothetical protein
MRGKYEEEYHHSINADDSDDSQIHRSMQIGEEADYDKVIAR